jgi:hypothetical protein
MKKEINQKQGLIMKIFGLFVAFTLMCFSLLPVAHAVVPAPDEDSPNVAESAAMGKAANHPNQRMILFDYTTDPIICSFNEQVELHGTIRLSFTRNGNKVTASLENFEGVGLTTKREYVADTVTVVKTRISSIPMTHGFGLLISPSNLDFIATLTIPVTGMHPTDLNSATGDPLPGQDVHFQLNYGIGWRSRNGKVTRFTPNLTGIPDGKGIISCF